MKPTEDLEIATQPTHERALAATAETASTAVAAHATALVQARYTVAIKFPRDLDVVRQKLLKTCKRPGFAKVARYRKPIGKGIEGPSIRFAEAAVQAMGNIVVEPVTLFDDREKRIVQVTITDLESNTTYTSSITIEKSVERKATKQGDVIIRERLNSRNEKVYLIEATEDDILNKQNALLSKAIRTNVLRLVPGDIVEECMDEVIETVKARDAQDPDGAKKQLFDSFAALGVRAIDIKLWLGHEGNTLTPKELSDLRGIYTAIKDGEANWREVMDEKMRPEKVPLDQAVAPVTAASATKGAA